MLTPYPGVIDAYTVTTRVNTPKMGPGTDSAAETFSSSTAGTKVSRGLAPISLAGWARLALNNQPLRLPISARIPRADQGRGHRHSLITCMPKVGISRPLCHPGSST